MKKDTMTSAPSRRLPAVAVAARAALLRRLAGDDGGFILLESVIAIALITVIMGAVGAEYVSSLAATNRERLATVASQIADSQMSQIRALHPSDLLTGRGATAVDHQRSDVALFTTVGPTSLEAYDPGAAPTDPGSTLSTAASTETIGKVTFTTYRYFECTTAPAGSCNSAGSGTVNNIRAVVVVTWPQQGCKRVQTSAMAAPASICSFSTASAINNDADLTFDLNQPLPPAPVVESTTAFTVARGDTVDRQLTTKAYNSGVAPLTWSLTSGSLPPGLQLSTSGEITGTVTPSATSATTTVVSTFTVRDAFLRTASRTITWTVEPQLRITPVPDQVSTGGQAISRLTLTATGGAGSGYTFTDPHSTLPPGLSLSSTGRVTGTPVTGGTYPVALQITDNQACPVCVTNPRTATVSFTWNVSRTPLAISHPGSQTATVGTTLTAAKQVTMNAAGGDGNYTWSSTGLPAGLTLSDSGVISGTPSAIGTSNVTVTVKDLTATVDPVSTSFTWAVVAQPTLSTPADQRNAVGAPVNVATSPSCPDAPCTYVLNNGPTNLSTGGDGTITGVVGGGAKSYSGVTVTVTDSAGAKATTGGFTWTVLAAPTVGSLDVRTRSPRPQRPASRSPTAARSRAARSPSTARFLASASPRPPKARPTTPPRRR